MAWVEVDAPDPIRASPDLVAQRDQPDGIVRQTIADDAVVLRG
jgi:hypothetical protein